MTNIAVGIHGIGVYLPPEIRRNDWWPESVVRDWREKQGAVRPTLDPATLTDGKRRTFEAMAALRDDPFQGALERRVAPAGMTAVEMGTKAAQDALEKSGVAASDIDFVLSFTQVPDLLPAGDPCAIHRALGLKPDCFSLVTEAACNAFLMQLTLAQAMIGGGAQEGQAHRFGLLIQVGNVSRITRPEDQPSAWFGDGATAVVVGPVSAGKGLLGRVHRTDGSFYRALAHGIPGKRWYEDGRIIVYPEDPRATFEMVVGLADWSKIVLDALAVAKLGVDDVDFYASHQPAAWLRRVSQQTIGLHRARSVDTFPWAGSLGAANIPLQLAMGSKEGLLRDGDVVAAFAGGSGVTWSGTVLRWGR